MFTIMFFLSAMISIILILLNSLLGEKMFFSREMNSAFECGFDPKSSSRLPFSLHFFLIALIFLIFDIEITLLMPIPLIFTYSNNMSIEAIYWFFLMILIMGVVIEWKKGALEWAV